jgi:S1-C subfamily serine protease
MGDTNIDSVEAYMKALGKFKKGDSTNVVVLRSGLEKTFNITF